MPDPSPPLPGPKQAHPMRFSGLALAGVYLGLCVLPLLLAFGRDVARLDVWERAGAALGMVALVAMAIQVVTSGRFEVVSGRLGIDRIMAFHKVAAWWVLIAAVLHPLAYVWPTVAADPVRGAERLAAYLTVPHYRSGDVALAALLGLVLTAILRNRLPWRYEIWRATHLLLGLAALGGGLHHAVTTGRFSAMGPVLAVCWAVGLSVVAVMAVLYGWRWAALHRHPWRLAGVARLADRMWELDIQPGRDTPALGYSAGQFVWMTAGRRRFPLFDHPFSIADTPARPGLSLIVKEAGDFTGGIGGLALGTLIGIDGPYGAFTLDQHPGGAIVLVAGGVGIAPVMGILRDLVARRDPRPIRLAYAAGAVANFACLPEIEAAGQTLDLKVMLISEEGAAGWRGRVGRMSPDRLRDLIDGLDPQRAVALVCGPGAMITAVSDGLLDLGFPMSRIIYERFDYAGGASRQDRRRAWSLVAIGAALAGLVAGFALGQ